MQHSFLQKLILVVLAGFIVAGVYVFIYKGVIEGANQSINGGYKIHAKRTPAPTPRRY